MGRPRPGADGPRPGACRDAHPAAPRPGLNDLDAWEINEAFAAQVMGCIKAWEDPAYCKEQLGLDAPLGTLDAAKLNIDGGAIALGPSGRRLGRAHRAAPAAHPAPRKKKRGIATICIGGGQGGAVLVEAV
jgi:acetyl-CoA C-acetyltransferase